VGSVPFVVKLSATIGLTEVSEEDREVEDVLKRVDKALYNAKKRRKGSIGVAKSEEEFYTVK